ncbi:hypothetical protein [Chelatococcus reniformis]|uniref:Membrane protein n=1 Tax=Chelatococcus reniformis TaxID=1494448 RepID=A0A916UNG8_9HYPH|nr:hypothetical protein [Chelatococcus reniformis]GGC80606.1 membrane protein [Chelatococcus reniformis]
MSVSFSPLVPLWVLGVLAALAVVVVLVSLLARGPTALVRGVALALVLAGLANPSLLQEQREPVKDVVAVLVDRTTSQTLSDRATQTDRAKAEVERRLAALPDIEVRTADVTDSEGGGDGTRLFAALSDLLSDVPAERIAGAIVVTDGVVHDVPAQASLLGFKAPLHALITGHVEEVDRRVTLLEAPRFGIVGKDQVVRVEVAERGGTGRARLTLRRDGVSLGTVEVATNRPVPLPVHIEHGGPNVVEIEVGPLDGELTAANNRAVLTIEGIREKLRVLLVSGEPHPGERTWRNLLKSDANVDLVHFTILRPPEKQDGTPINELSLIAFPTRELFQQKIKEFDLIIFDRYANQSVLPSLYYENIVRYVRDGGALLVAAGPEYASAASLARTPLVSVLPAIPDGRIEENPFRAAVTPLGQRHPVTRELPGSETEPPRWGEWARLIGARVSQGSVVMDGIGERPLVVLAREQKGRVALLLSDHAWLWARNYRGGGPYLDLLRRTSHWLMKEPELEEEALRATGHGREISIERQTMGDDPGSVTITAPSGSETTVALSPDKPGLFRAAATAREQGLYRLRSGELMAFVSVGPENPRELADVFSDTGRLQPLAEATGGSVRRIEAAASGVSVPRIVEVRSGSRFTGADWIGIRPSDSAVVRGVSVFPLGIGLIALGLLLGAVLAAWLAEGRLPGQNRA